LLLPIFQTNFSLFYSRKSKNEQDEEGETKNPNNRRKARESRPTPPAPSFSSLCSLIPSSPKSGPFFACVSRLNFFSLLRFFFSLNPKRQKTSFFSRPQTKVLFIGEVRGYNLHTRSLKNIFNKSSSSG
jgi:hypothetical protein